MSAIVHNTVSSAAMENAVRQFPCVSCSWAGTETLIDLFGWAESEGGCISSPLLLEQPQSVGVKGLPLEFLVYASGTSVGPFLLCSLNCASDFYLFSSTLIQSAG